MAIDSFPTTIGGLLDALADLGAGANWQERLKDLAITTPDKKRYKPRFMDVATSKTNKTSTYQFSEVEGDYVQNFGRGSSDYSLTVYFEGDNYDKDATKFETSLGKKGSCELNHPRYGTFDVVVTGWQRSDNETSGAGQAKIDLKILETIKLTVPGLKTPGLGLFTAIADFINAAIDAYNKFESTVDTINKDINTITAIINGLSTAVSTIISESPDVGAKFTALETSIKSSISTLIDEPDELAASLAELFLLPSASIADEESTSTVDDLISAYDEAYISVRAVSPTASDDKDFINAAATCELTSGFIIAAKAQSYINGSYLTVADATEALNAILDDFNDNQAFNDANQTKSAGNDLMYSFNVSDEQADALKNVVSTASNILLQLAFDAKREIIKTLNKDYTIIDLSFELYGSTDNDTIQFLINTNELTGADLLILYTGRTVKYYV